MTVHNNTEFSAASETKFQPTLTHTYTHKHTQTCTPTLTYIKRGCAERGGPGEIEVNNCTQPNDTLTTTSAYLKGSD